MFDLKLDTRQAGPIAVGGAPEGHDARVLAAIAGNLSDTPLLHVAVDDSRAARLAELIGFFAPDLPVVVLPAWDCLPYDRVSPNPQIIARRVSALGQIAAHQAASQGSLLVITTINAAVQRLPTRDSLASSHFTVAVADRLDLDALQLFLAKNGYSRTQTVREWGEFAMRGDIIDLFPPGADEPCRIDLFGDDVERLRTFDALSQRTSGTIDRLDLLAMGELFLDEASIERFRAGYRRQFGAVTDDDPLYEAVSAGRRYAGMEHWLPLFHEAMETIFDHLPSAPVSLDPQIDQAREARLVQIADFHEARLTLQATERKAKAPVYKPLPPDALYLTADEWQRHLAERPVAMLSPFAPPPGAKGAIDARGRGGRDFTDARNAPEGSLYDAVRVHVASLKRDGRSVLIAGYTRGARDRLAGLLRDHGLWEVEAVDALADVGSLDSQRVASVVLPIEHGFVAPDLAVITETDILGDRLTRQPKQRRKAEKFIAEISALSEGDYVVHVEHGVGRYEGLDTLDVGGAAHDFVRLIYAENAKLFVPVENIEVLSRYGSDDTIVQLDRLGGAAWQARKSRVKKRLKDMADALMGVAAARELRKGEVIEPGDGAYDEFAARFPYPETDDQLSAIADVLHDLGSGRPMDRLICGDVGFGKTEVALRAAFLAAISGRQVAVVVPTTLLARQHYQNFVNRFANLPIRVGRLSRLTPATEQKAVRAGLADGTVDIVIGTHALLGKQIQFKQLGLVIIDEEQHFGVKQKEKLKQLKANTHVLTLTATPIPRTLQMALAGVRELSLISTPPIDRLAVRSFVLPYDPVVVREALLREHFRGGQTYYVCPRIQDLEGVREALTELVPEIRVAMAHGRMAPSQLEEVMTAFYDGQFDVLLCTSIVESGLDIPSANTIVIHRADMFGLAQLYQLRGRIGRSKVRGYAYLTYRPDRPLSAIAQQRLHVIETLDTLGAGFTLASHDMDIRGAGNLLGEEQSGHVREVGIELYQQLLEEAVAAARGDVGDADDEWAPQINLGIPVLIPEAYVPDLQVRLDLYRRVAKLVDRSEIDAFAAELIDRFGPLPDEVENLLTLVSLKRLCKQAGIDKLDAGPKGAIIGFRNDNFANPAELIGLIAQRVGTLKLRPDHRLVVVQGWDKVDRRVDGVRRFVTELADLAAAA
ncbi:MAG: transcription-repair coupling factor [Pseudomonadota bacterium]